VCICEDNLINRKIALSFVQKLGLKCDAYEDGKQGYEALQRASKEDKPYHLVLMDVQMPVLDGYNATKAIRKDEDPRVSQVLVIALTASAIRGDREKCLEAGMNDYLAKLVRQTALKAMLDEYLSNTKPVFSPSAAVPTPSDVANRENLKISEVSNTPVNGTTEAASSSPGLGSKDDTTPDQQPRSIDAPSQITTLDRPAERTEEQAAAAKPKKRRIALKGSSRNKPSSEEQNISTTSTANGTLTPSIHGVNGEKSSPSPPSGIQETNLFGKVSTEILSPPASGPSKEEAEKELSNTVSEQRRNDSLSSQLNGMESRAGGQKNAVERAVSGA